MRKEGKMVKHWWFQKRVMQLIKDANIEEKNVKASDRWFSAFCQRYNISLRKKTHTAQKAPEHLRPAVTKFHAKHLRERQRGKYEDCDIANMDQTPLPFVLDDGKTYSVAGAKEVWCATGATGLDKRQCTAQLTIFADGISRVRPTIIFVGKERGLPLLKRQAGTPG